MNDEIELRIRRIESELTRSKVPIEFDLWTAKEIAAYLKRSDAVVRDRITALPSFPQAIRLPSGNGKGKGQPLWEAMDVIRWARAHKSIA